MPGLCSLVVCYVEIETVNLAGFDVIQETHLLVVSVRAFPELSVDILNIGSSSCGLGF